MLKAIGTNRQPRWLRAFAVLPVLGALGCASTTTGEMAGPPRLSVEVREVLATWPSPEYQRERARLQAMGPEVDSVLVVLAQDRRARTEVRVNALILLADRQSPAALPTLQRALLWDNNERLRAAAVLGLHRLAPESEAATDLIRRATEDRARVVRLNALQSLDIRQVETMRELARNDEDPEVRQVALQLVALAEGRGAPLSADRRGSLRTVGSEREPQIVFRPATADTDTGIVTGDLRLELPDDRDVPLAAAAKVVNDVVPAFFSPDRSAVVFEAHGEIRVLDVATREVRSVGPGVAPRPIPFSHEFVFVREVAGASLSSDFGTEVVYDVYRAGFEDGQTERIGQLRSLVEGDAREIVSPVRWMVVGDARDRFALRGDGIETFELPVTVWRPQ
jgi:hypothetical protein